LFGGLLSIWECLVVLVEGDGRSGDGRSGDGRRIGGGSNTHIGVDEELRSKISVKI